MRLLKLDKFLILFFILCCYQSRSQEVINTVGIQKSGAGLYKVQYKLNSSADYDVDGVVLKIFRRRNGKIEEIFSKKMVSQSLKRQGLVYDYNWKPENGAIKTGDELQAKIVVSYKVSVAKQKTNQPNKTPYADAGNSLEAELPLGKPIALNGSKSHDDDGKIVSSQWR